MRRTITFAITIAIAAWVALPTTMSASATTVAAPRAASPCSGHATFTLDIASAAKVRIVVGKSKKARPAGTAQAQKLANEISGGDAPTPCDAPVSEWDQATLDEIQGMIDSGDTEGAVQYINDLVDSITVPDASASTTRRAPRNADPCSGFGVSDITLPSDVPFSLGLAAKAQLVGDDAAAIKASAKAIAVLEAFARSGANGQAQTIGDWLRLAAQLQTLGADDALSNQMLANAQGVAKDAYDQYNKAKCRQTKESVNCYFRAAMAMMLLGNEPEPSMKDMQEAAMAAVDLNKGRRPRGCVETYSFQWRMSSQVDSSQYLTMDTGPIVFDAEWGKITSDNTGPLTLSTVKNANCWEKTDEGGWRSSGTADVTGGSFPYRVTGTDIDNTLRLRFLQDGAWRVTGSGNTGCQFLIALADQLLNGFPEALRQGIEMPAGVKTFEFDDISYAYDEPTGLNLKTHWYFSLKLLKSSSR